MLIAIDFDETLTRDAALWRGFIALAKEQGHRIVCVTARRCTEDNQDTIDQWMESHGCCLPVFFTGLASKVEHMAKIGQPVDIWIDDDPKRCALGH
jgi:hypothetical protein